jgi:hypothetical protein
MTPQRALQFVTIAFLLLSAVSIAVGFAEDEFLPAPLREWQEGSTDALSLPLAVILGVLAIGCIVSVLVASVALLLMKRWGAWLHLASMLVAYVLVFFLGPLIQLPVTYVVENMSTLAAGAIYGLAFFSDALPSRKEQIQPPELGAERPK